MILVLIGLCLSAGWFSNFSSFYQKKLIGQQTQAEESITFAPGEIKKEIQLTPGKWTSWIKMPTTRWTYRLSEKTLVQFYGEQPFFDEPGRMIDFGSKVGVFRFSGCGVVTVTQP